MRGAPFRLRASPIFTQVVTPDMRDGLRTALIPRGLALLHFFVQQKFREQLLKCRSGE